MAEILPSLSVNSDRQYSIDFTDSWLETLSLEIRKSSFLVFVPKHLESEVLRHFRTDEIVVTKDGEEQKTLAAYSSYIEQIAARGLDRSSVLIGIGGGATTDLTGFLAATYMRGIDWIAIPTTVAGMVDAAVGGKTGINLDSGKNLAGAFYSPKRVIIDLAWLGTLSKRDLNAGLAESVKCGFIADPKILELINDDAGLNLAEIVHRSIAVKAKLVTSDFRESYEREALNYGHTLGHAIERDSSYAIRHGEAISIGLIFAAKISERFSNLDPKVADKHIEILKSLDLPISYEGNAWPRLVDLMHRDKKRKSEKLRFVTLPRLGETERIEVLPLDLEDIYKEHIAR